MTAVVDALMLRDTKDIDIEVAVPNKRPQSVRPELFFYGPKLAAQPLFQEPRN
jgi:hypothetical protein